MPKTEQVEFEMPLESAVRILNERKHKGSDEWVSAGCGARGPDQYDWYSAFETVAIAEKYQRSLGPQDRVSQENSVAVAVCQ